jgi:hypothetical protein
MPSSAGSKKPVAPVHKDDAMNLQKELINRNYRELASARADNRKVSATFVPGNLNELLMCFDFARSLPRPTRCRTACARSPASSSWTPSATARARTSAPT